MSDDLQDPTDARPGPLSTGLKMRCPYCGQGKLFDGFLSLQKSCSHCKAGFAAIDSGDGPAFFVMFLVSILVVIPAVIIEIQLSPPYWIYPAFFAPLALFLSIALLRPFKGVMIAMQVHFKAREGLEDREEGGES